MGKAENILIFGGSGFIGTSLCKRLKNSQKYSFKIYDKVYSRENDEHTIIGDVTNEIISGSNPKFNILINLAAEHKDNVKPSSLYYSVNVEGAKNICKYASLNDIDHIIFTSTVAVYGLNVRNGGSNLPAPFNDYGHSKLMAENIYLKWQSEAPKKRKLTIIRPTVVFGEGNKGNFYNLIKQIYLRKFLMIGNGSNVKSLAYVENLSKFLEYCLDNPKKSVIYNYVDTPNQNMNVIIKQIYSSMGRKHINLFVPRFFGLILGRIFDFLSLFSNTQFPISYIRIKKFCANSEYEKNIPDNFSPPYTLNEAISKTILYEIKNF